MRVDAFRARITPDALSVSKGDNEIEERIARREQPDLRRVLGEYATIKGNRAGEADAAGVPKQYGASDYGLEDW